MRTRITKLCKTAFVLVFLLSASTSLLAQTSDRPNNIQLYGTALSYNGDLGSQFWESTEKGGGITYNRFLSPSFDASLDFAYNTTQRTFQEWQKFEGPVPTLMLGVKLKMYGTILKEDALIGPYLVAKVGGMYVNTDGRYGTTSAAATDFEESTVTAAAAGGAGIRFRITDAISLFGETTYILTGNDMVDGVSGGDNDRFLEHRGGIGINLGKSKDTDMDGVPDRRDKCPDTPTGVQVDKEGCPVDTDGDGVADYQDECPTEAGVANLKGCPDRDN
ncbi:thrombospondin type 3 repeat-containing protein, partial [Pontibacter locisalis]